MRPYKSSIAQYLTESHCEKREKFCIKFLEKIESNEKFLSSVIFSDEAKFYVDGTVSTHQFRTWAKTNPHKSKTAIHAKSYGLVWLLTETENSSLPFQW